MMQDSILKVEKENMETIQSQKSCQSKQINSILAGASVKNVESKLQPYKKKLKEQQLPPTRNKENNYLKPEVEHKLNADARNCSLSTIKFLNHFESSLKPLRPHRYISNKITDKEKYFPCAVPLGTDADCNRPSNKSVLKAFSRNETKVNFNNNFVHHIYSEDKPKQLTVQHLPCITIPKLKTSTHSSFVVERIHEKKLPQTTVKSSASPKIFFQKVCSDDISLKDACSQTNRTNLPADPSHPSFDDDFNGAKQNKDVIEEAVRKAIETIKEKHLFLPRPEVVILKDFGTNPLEEAEVVDVNRDCKICSPKTNLLDTNLKSSECQTENIDSLRRIEEFTKTPLKNVILEALTEFHQRESRLCSSEVLPRVEKVHKEVQTSKETSTRNNGTVSSSSVQVSLEKRHSMKDTSTQMNSFHESNRVSFEEAPCAPVNKPPQPVNEDAILSRLEVILNGIYDRYRREKMEVLQDTTPKLRPTMSTRDVSVQFNPITRETRSTNTWKAEQLHSSVQCDALVPDIPACIPAAKPTSDACIQTGRQVPRSPSHRNESSAFWDEELSEGEIPLPWNLRLLSIADPFSTTNRINSSDVTDTSENEKDLSLSEGEIHPMYLLYNLDRSQLEISNRTIESSSSSVRRSPGEIPSILCHQHHSPSADRRWSQ